MLRFQFGPTHLRLQPTHVSLEPTHMSLEPTQGTDSLRLSLRSAWFWTEVSVPALSGVPTDRYDSMERRNAPSRLRRQGALMFSEPPTYAALVAGGSLPTTFTPNNTRIFHVPSGNTHASPAQCFCNAHK